MNVFEFSLKTHTQNKRLNYHANPKYLADTKRLATVFDITAKSALHHTMTVSPSHSATHYISI